MQSQTVKKHRAKQEEISLQEGEEVDLIVDSVTDIGVKVIIDEQYEGLLYKNEIYRELHIGDRLKGFIRKIRDDRKIDVTLRKGGPQDIEDARFVLLRKLKEKKGFLPLSDNSAPGAIREDLQMSKKLFKKAIGGLYKDGIIDLRPDGIHLKKGKGAKD
jgi:predicted RNA-binding protein (virulence factor B family)